MRIDGSAASDAAAAAATGSNWQQKLATSAANLAGLLCQFDSVAGQAVKTASESTRVASCHVAANANCAYDTLAAETAQQLQH